MASRRSRLFFGHQNPPKSRRSSTISLSQLRKKPSISLQQAARDGRGDVIQNWLDRQPRNKRKAFVNKKDADGYAALHYAAMFNWFNIMRQLVDAGADADVKADDGSTPLHFAAKYLPTYPKEDTQSPETPEIHEDPAPSSSKAVELLVKECRSIVNAQDNNGLTPLHMACTRGNREAVDILLQAKDIEVNITESRNAHAVLHDACILGDDWIVEKLLQKGANILLQNDDGMLPLHLACQEGHSEVAKLILQHANSSQDARQDDEEKRHTVATNVLAATNVITRQAGAPSRLLLSTLDIKDNTNNTPLHYACDSGATEIVNVLIEQKATTSLFNIDGLTPMHIAARHGFTDIADILLKSDTTNITLLDNKQQTPLHHAAKQNQVDMVDFLLKMGANIDAHDRDAYTPLLSAAMYGRKETFTHLVSRRASLDVVGVDKKTCMFLAAEHNHVDILQVLVDDEQGVKLSCGTDSKLNTPLHVAAMRGNLEALKVLFKAPIRINARNEESKMPLHLAAENGHLQIAKALLEYEKGHQHEDRTSISDDGDEDLNTPLHLACSHGHYHFAKYFLEIYADPNARNSRLLTPMHCAASGGWDQILELLIEADANIGTKAEDQVTPLHLACEKGNLKCVEILIHHGADVRIKREQSQFNCLDVAIENGQEKAAMAIIQSKRWDEALRNTTGDKRDTPMRKLIRRMPSVAEAVLNRCMKVRDNQTPNSPDFEVTFNFEFLEDFSRPEPGLIELATELQSGLQEGFHAGLHGLQNLGDRLTKSRGDLTALEEEDAQSVSNEEEDEEKKEKSKYWFTSWGPPEFKKSNHPLSIMVESEQTCLLKHPLVTTLLDYKWRHYTSVAYFFNFAIYIIFVLLLTAFALEVHNPQDEICNLEEAAPLNETGGNGTGTVNKTGCADRDRSTYLPFHFDGDPDKRPVDFWYLFLAAITIAFLAITRLVMEAFQLLLRRREYITDWINWLENIVFGSSIVFVWIFHSDCYCETSWQWQVGVIAVFCAWIDLIIFVEKIPFMGIYVVMFLHIFYTFLRMVVLAFLLVVSFSLAFYMLFYEPDGFSRFPFATPGRAIVKTFTMTTGEFDFDTLFRQSGDEEDDIEYPPVSIIIWFIFIVLMPILLTNLLVGLAVGDIQEIQEVAVLKRLELQVDLALSVEKRMPSKMRQWLLTGEIKIRPNQKPNLCERFLYTIWGGRGCDPAEIRQAALQSDQQRELDDGDDVQQHTKQLVNDMDAMKRSVQEMNVFLSQIAKKMDIPAEK